MNEEMMSLYRVMVVERHTIWLSRQMGEPQPWTTDPVLANLKMTNMFRVLDPGSQFVFELDTEDPVDMIARLFFYRITNLPSTWYALRSSLGRFPLAADFVEIPEKITAFLDLHRSLGNNVFSGAYIIIPEPATANDKVEGAVRVTRNFVIEKAEAFLEADTQEKRYTVLLSTLGIGKFLAMQILTDWGYLQEEQPDLSFIKAGPGAVRGAALLDPTKKPEDMIYDLAFNWMDHPLVNLRGRSLTLMDVQNTLCEFGKYARERVHRRKKTIYKPSHPGVQPTPIVPAWW